jgi:hypothetical protein
VVSKAVMIRELIQRRRENGCRAWRGVLPVAILLVAGFVAPAPAQTATPISLLVPQSTAFSVLGRSCGGIQEQVLATGFDPVTGNPVADVYLQTRCGGSGRGGGYKTTTYSAWLEVAWNLDGVVATWQKLAGAPGGLDPTFSVQDQFGNELYNTLGAINVLPANCSIGNITYCTYRAWLLPAAGVAPTGACGDANADGKVTATDALLALRAAVGTAACDATRCDYDDSLAITATDALEILRASVGDPTTPNCPA